MTAPDIITAMRDPELFGPHFEGTSWRAWEAFLRSLFGLPLSRGQRAIVRECTGLEKPRKGGYSEAWLPCGRRSGKSRILAFIAVYLACFRDWTVHLAAGERAMILVMAADRRQARTIYRFIVGFLESVPMLAGELEREPTEERIDLRGRISIEITTASFRRVRGYAVAAALCDEIAFWMVEGRNPDSEIIDALRPAMATLPGSMLLCASSPYARRGTLYEAFRDHHGKDGSEVLVWRAPTLTMNPTVPKRIIEDAYERDPAWAAAEYGAEFRTDLELLFTREVIESAVIPGRVELPPMSGRKYVGFVDPSGGSSDAMTLCIAHSDGDAIVVDAVRERRPPFSPDDVAGEFATLLKSYRVRDVIGDHYGGEWPRERFRAHGVSYRTSDRNKSAIYLEALPLLNAGRVDLPDLPRLTNELINLERRTSRGGRDSVDHPPGAHDDLANAVCGALVNCDPAKRHVVITRNLAGEPEAPRAWNPRPGGTMAQDCMATPFFVTSRRLSR